MIVCKFGGSSLADAARIRQVATIVRADPARRFVVVSAPGRRFEGDKKITDLLIRAWRGDEGALASALARFRETAAALGVEMESEICELQTNLRARNEAFAVSRGEFLCALLLAKFLRFEFVDAADIVAFRANGLPDTGETYARMQRRLKSLKNAVIPGFYGAFADGTVHTFPRGGSDISGALAAGAMGAGVYENWTDVDGFMSADPKIVPNTVCVPALSYRQMRLLSAMGAQILHPHSLLPVSRAGIPTRLKNSFRPEHPGTRIAPDARADTPCITGRTLKNGLCVLAVLSPEAMDLPARALAALRTRGIRAQSLCAYPDHLLLHVRACHFPEAVRALHGALVEGALP